MQLPLRGRYSALRSLPTAAVPSHSYTHTYTHTHAHTRPHIHIHTYTHTHAHTYIHTRTHTHARTFTRPLSTKQTKMRTHFCAQEFSLSTHIHTLAYSNTNYIVGQPLICVPCAAGGGLRIFPLPVPSASMCLHNPSGLQGTALIRLYWRVFSYNPQAVPMLAIGDKTRLM